MVHPDQPVSQALQVRQEVLVRLGLLEQQGPRALQVQPEQQD